MHGDITDVPGVLLGHDTNLEAGTGCTVVVCQWPAIGGVDVRGGAPATRETDLLDPRCMVAEVNAVLLTGGSAFGLDAASGVMRVLEARGVGFDTGVAHVPIVPTAALFDLGLGRPDVRPDAQAGARATEAAAQGPIARGTVGAGTGATVGKAGGPQFAVKSGLGSASIVEPGLCTIGAVVAVNAVGDVYDPDTGAIVAGARNPSGVGWLARSGTPPGAGPVLPPFGRVAPSAGSLGVNTTIGVVATDAALTKAETSKVAQMAQDGIALSIRPAHTPFDGDTIFALSLARPDARAASPGGAGPQRLGYIGALAARVVALAVIDAVRTATGLHGVPAAREVAQERE